MKTYEQAIERAAEYYFNDGGTDEMSRIIFSFQYSTAVCMVSHIYEVPTEQVEQDIVRSSRLGNSQSMKEGKNDAKI